MSKTPRRTKRKRATRAGISAPRRTMTRREYAEIVVRLATVEVQTQRQRAALEGHEQRLARLQEQLDAVKTAAATQAAANDISALPLPAAPTIES